NFSSSGLPRKEGCGAVGESPARGYEDDQGPGTSALRAKAERITTLINHKDKPKRSDKTLQAIQRVGQAVNLAVARFVTVGEAIADENHELKEEMNVACIEAKRAGETIAQLTDVASLYHPESDSHITIFTDKTGIVKAARLLLSSVTKVLVLADRIVIKQIITSRNKVFVAFLSFFYFV
uniref:Uncharacterized protein n=1 Tax=Nothoprocta perdicaria TaxID=30464 RepID=A0A8C6ZLU8_NOTPE